MKKLFVIFILLATALFSADAKTVKLAVVNTPKFTGLMDYLLEDFKKDIGYDVEIYGGSDVYDRARAGDADIVISHYGKYPVKKFVLDGFGSFPKMVFSNQAVIIGPKDDPAKIRGMKDAGAALKKIAESGEKFYSNPLPTVNYLVDTLLVEEGINKGKWFVESGRAKGQLAKYAHKNKAYYIWGANPFLRFKKKKGIDSEILVHEDAIFQRVMSISVVNPKKVQGVNHKGALALEKFLLSPKIQGKIHSFRSQGVDKQFWWPMGRHN